jgi:transcription termination/antitermination protein NusA
MPNEDAELIARLFAQEVPEVAAGVVEIKGIARRPRYRSKLAVYSHDPKVDAVGVCVGIRGCRIKKVIDQLAGERLDLVRWHDSPEVMVGNALQPAAIDKVILHHAQHRATVVVQEDQLAYALGRQGMNRDLASQLCGWAIDVVTQ